MPPVVASLLPVFLIIVTGAFLRWRQVVPATGWQGLEQVTYHVFFPAIIVMTLAKADLSGIPVVKVASALILGILIMATLLFALRKVLADQAHVSGPAFSSVFQGATRWNSFVAIATAGALFGAQGLTLTAISVAAMIPLLNILAVIVLARYARNETVSLGPTLRAIVTNPFIWSSALGIAIHLSGIPLPKFIVSYGDILGQAALATGLLLVGAGLDVSGALRPRFATYLATCLKLVLMPAIVTGLALSFGVTGVPLMVAVLSAAMPTASGSYILARQLGGDAPLMAEILTVQTLAAIITIPIVLSLVQ